MERWLPGAERLRGSLPLVMLTVVVMIWSSNNIATKLVLHETSPGLLTLMRFTLTTLIFHLPAFLLIRRFGQPLGRRDWLRLGIASVTGYALSPVMFMLGISMTPATYAALMMMTGPLWTAVLERAFIGTPIGPAQGLGMAISFASAAFLATGGALVGGVGELNAGLLIGGVLLMGCQTTWGGYTILTKPLLAHRPPLVIVTAASLIATPTIWPVAGWMGAFGELATIPTWSWTTWLGLAYLIFVAGVCSQVLYAYGLRDVTPSQAMAFTYLMPVFTAVFAAIFLDEQVTPATAVCGAAIVFGLWLVNRSRSQPRPARRLVTERTAEPALGPPAASRGEG